MFEAHLDLVGCPSMQRARLLIRDALDAPRPVLLAANAGARLCLLSAERCGADGLVILAADAARYGLVDGESAWIDLGTL